MASIVAFRAHPDDEVLLVGGTLAQLAAAGHDVLVVLATDGGAGLAAGGPTATELAELRMSECRASCAALGLPPPVWLGYRDSGETGPLPHASFASIPLDVARDRLISVLGTYRAEVLIVDDRVGGYGHRDHRRVHEVGMAAAELSAMPEVYSATIDRTTLRRAIAVARWAPGVPRDFRADRVHDGFSSRSEITHRVDVRTFCEQKQAAMRAHASQLGGGTDARTLTVLSGLPLPVFRAVLGHEWFVRRGQQPRRPLERQLVLPTTSTRS
jgi:LmbE family N-acetylglucosaminyl deacetylase